MDLKGSYFRGDGQASSEWKAGTDGERAHLDFGVRANPATGKVGPRGRSGLVPATRWDSGLRFFKRPVGMETGLTPKASPHQTIHVHDLRRQ